MERSLLAYATVLCSTAATGLFCIPHFPLVFLCAGVLPLLSIGVLMALYMGAFLVALRPEPHHLVPGALATAALLAFYIMRLAVADGGAVHGPRALGDYLLGALSALELGVLGYGFRERLRARQQQQQQQQQQQPRGGFRGWLPLGGGP